MNEKPISLVFSKVAELHRKLGLPNLKTLGLWEYKIDTRWEMVVNGTDSEKKVAPNGTMGWKVKPYHAVFFYNGWAAGECSPYGGWVAAGEAANEDTLLDALTAAITAARP